MENEIIRFGDRVYVALSTRPGGRSASLYVDGIAVYGFDEAWGYGRVYDRTDELYERAEYERRRLDATLRT